MGMPETVCRTSGLDVISFHFSNQDLIEPALNFFTFCSRNCFKISKSYTSNILSKFNVLFGNCCVFGLDDSGKSYLFIVAWVDNLESFAYILESSSGTWKRTWSLMAFLTIFSYLNLFCLSTRTLTCFAFLYFYIFRH